MVEQAARRQEREAVKARREIERQRKALIKLTEQEQARLEVQAYENDLDVLLSIHKECRDPIDWMGLFCILPPAPPSKLARHELEAIFKKPAALGSSDQAAAGAEADFASLETAQKNYLDEHAQWHYWHTLAQSILQQNVGAYSQAINDFAPFAEIAQLGSAMRFVIHTPTFVECTLTVNGLNIIPSEIKSLNASAKLSTRKMPQGRFHEIYQDYVCGSALRVAREIFALLPVEHVLVTTVVNDTDPASGNMAEIPVLSVRFDQPTFNTLQFDHLDPSDSISLFEARGDATASRRSGAFTRIQPFTPEDFSLGSISARSGLLLLVARAQEQRELIKTASSKIRISEPNVSPA
ncbi:hypothetical protein [Terrimicrobium sacchariphilum]|nr:hypothetical protein [Terrimicrobium sacchariphilum]